MSESTDILVLQFQTVMLKIFSHSRTLCSNFCFGSARGSFNKICQNYQDCSFVIKFTQCFAELFLFAMCNEANEQHKNACLKFP
jgi:hypothetical protein